MTKNHPSVDPSQRIYLDNSATSFPKPESVYRAVDHYQRNVGAPAGRGSYREASEVSRRVGQTRNQVAELVGAGSEHQVVFTFSGTDSLCTAILGLLKTGDHVVTSTAEHNSVLRPLRFLEEETRISVTRVDCDDTGFVAAEKMIAAIQPTTGLVVLTHVSNVTGAIQPVEAIGKHCRENGIVFLIDAAQSLGHLPVKMNDIGCDILAASGHKGLLGPLGTGILCLSNSVADQIRPLRLGGTGTIGGTDLQPDQLPDKFESGNLNVPGIAGLQAGIEFLSSSQGRDLQSASLNLKAQLRDGLKQIDGVKLHGPDDLSQRTAVFSLSVRGMACTDVAATLDSVWSIQCRAGLHCAPLIHRSLGTAEQGGTVRLSLGLFNTGEQIALTLAALEELVVP